MQSKCSKEATVPANKEQVLVAKKPDSMSQSGQNVGTIVDDKDEAVDRDGDASLPHLHSGATHPKPPQKLSVRKYYHCQVAAADAERCKTCEDTAKRTKSAPKKGGSQGKETCIVKFVFRQQQFVQ